MRDRVSAEVEVLWERFQQTVNMTSEELRTLLLTVASGEDASPAKPGLGVPALGRRVVDVLRKRKVDLTADDLEVMRTVVEYVEDKTADPPAASGARHERWRRSLMAVGHDPLKPG